MSLTPAEKNDLLVKSINIKKRFVNMLASSSERTAGSAGQAKL